MRHGIKWVFLVGGLLVFGGCQEEQADTQADTCPQGNRVSQKALAPRRLKDTEDLKAFIEKFPQERYQIAEVKHLGRFYIDDNPALVKKVLKSGNPWEAHVLNEFAKFAREGTTVIDAGAHIGSLTVPLARLVGPKGVVYAFEPQRRIYRELVHNLRLNRLENAVPLRVALGAKLAVIEMEPEAANDGRTRVGRGGDRVELRTIDSYGFCNVSLIKIDVEGFEAEVLRGAEQTIKKWRPVLIVEITYAHNYDSLPPKDKQRVDLTRKILDDYGYELRPILKGLHDYLALPKGK